MQKLGRTALALLLLDAEISRMFHHDPAIRQPLSQLPQSASSESFAAGNAEAWKGIMLMDAASSQILDSRAIISEYETTESSIDTTIFPDRLGELTLYVLLQRIGATISCSPPDRPLETQSTTYTKDVLISWYMTYRNTVEFRGEEPQLMTLWHSLFVHLYSNQDSLERASGREGPETQNSHQSCAQAWARSLGAKKCMVHSVLLLRQFKRMQIGTEPPIHVPMSLYRCGIAWYCFSRYGSKASLEPPGELIMPELEALGVDAEHIFLEDVGPRITKPPEYTLVSIVDLLQRISHWKVADRLASTLLALIDKDHIAS
jgi:hypothetical protein